MPTLNCRFSSVLNLTLRATNEAETRSELRNGKLTIPRLHVHVEAAGGASGAMALPAIHNKEVWYLVAVYLFAMIVFGFINSVLSVIFVIEAVISSKGELVPAYIPLSVDIPETYNGKTVDPCTLKLSAPGCAYELALTSLSSQLVTYAPYTIGGVTFEPPNGTLGLPYYAMKHFADQVESSSFEEEYRQYCLPVLDPHIIKCTEEPFNQSQGETNSSLVRYKPMHVSETDSFGLQVHSVVEQPGMYEVIVDYPNHDLANIKYRTNDQGQGTMVVLMRPHPVHWRTSVVTASDNAATKVSPANGYASLLYRMMYGVYPDLSAISDKSTFYFAAKCEIASIKYHDNLHSSWRMVDFTLRNGVLRANVTDERCPNPRPAISGFDDLNYALQAAAEVLSSTDGYSKLFNENSAHGTGTSIFDGMSRLDATVNKIYHIIQTSWSQSSYKYAMKNQTIYDHPIMMTNYPHRYVIRIHWTPTTYIGLVLSLLIALNAYALAGRWVRATYRFGFEEEAWNLLRPVDLMAYSLAAYRELIHDLNTVDHRRDAMRGRTRTVLRERAIKEGTQSLIGLVSGSPTQSHASTSVASSPVSTFGSMGGSPTSTAGSPTGGVGPLGPVVSTSEEKGEDPTEGNKTTSEE